MNEPWVHVSSTMREVYGGSDRPTNARDRLGVLQAPNGSSSTADEGISIGSLKEPSKQLLLIEDSDDDAFLFNLALRRSGRQITVQRAANGTQARELLSRMSPCLIALDCHLLGESGLDLLREIRSMASFRPVPIVMMSGTESEADLQAAYANGANSFVRKPSGYEEYMDCVSLLLNYWIDENCTCFEPGLPPYGVLLG